jgi:type I restriction enzyme S subunit
MKKDWEICPLDKYVKFIDYRGHTPTKTQSGMRLITAKNVKDGFLQREPEEFVDPKIYDKWMVRGFPKKGDVLFTTEAPLANVAQLDTDEKVLFAQRIIILQPQKQKIDQTFLKYLLLSEPVRKQIFSKGTGATVQGIKARLLKTIEIPVPPLPEQERIVSVLDEAFASIAQARSNAERNLVNARELFESVLRELFSDGMDWEEKTLGEITDVQSGGTPLRSTKEYWNGNIPWYSSGELNNLYTEEPERKITKQGLDNSNAKIFPEGSLLMGMYDTAALKMSILDRDGTFNQAIAGAKPNNKLDLKFVMYAIRVVKPEILNQRRGVRQKNLSLEKIKNIPIILPPLAEQRAIVARLEALSAETGRLDAVYRQKVAALEELKKSVLARAFSGELTAKVIP